MEIKQLLVKLDEAKSKDEKWDLSLQLKLAYAALNDEEKDKILPFFKDRIENLLKSTSHIDLKLVELGLAKPEEIPGFGLY
jgi:hypothetical protein